MDLNPLTSETDAWEKPDVIVIGAGHNGLVAACYLARAGFRVEVVEASASIGGCTKTECLIPQAPEHYINVGAVDFLWIRASNVISDLGLRRYGYEERVVDPAFAYLHRDGSSIAVWKDPVKTADELRRFSRADADAYLQLARSQDVLFNLLMPFLTSNPTRPPLSAILAVVGGAVAHARQLAPFSRLPRLSAVDIIDDTFRHPMARDLVAGMAAIAAPVTSRGSGLALLFGGMVHRLGMGRPVGGSQALPDALQRCLTEHGGRVRTSAEVDEVLVSGQRVHGVRLADGTVIDGQTVLASCDPKTTLTRLVSSDALPQRLARRARRIPTGNMGTAHVKVDLALSDQLRLPRHGANRTDGLDLRVPSTFTGSMEELVGAIDQARSGRIPDPLPLWCIVPTAIDPSQAPAGQDTLYLWSGWMPSDPPEGWQSRGRTAADAVVSSASDYFADLDTIEIGRHVKTPYELERDLRLPDGQPWHVDFTRSALGPLRPARGFGGYRTPIRGLFLTGAGTHPSPGVAAIPGQLAAREVVRTLSSR